MSAIRALAEEIVGELFVNGFGETADRLVLTQDLPNKRDLGGWGRRAAVDVVAKTLAPLEVTTRQSGAPVRRPKRVTSELAVVRACKGIDGDLRFHGYLGMFGSRPTLRRSRGE